MVMDGRTDEWAELGDGHDGAGGEVLGGDEGLPGTGGFILDGGCDDTHGRGGGRVTARQRFSQTGFPDTLVPCQPAQMTDTACLFLASSFS